MCVLIRFCESKFKLSNRCTGKGNVTLSAVFLLRPDVPQLNNSTGKMEFKRGVDPAVNCERGEEAG